MNRTNKAIINSSRTETFKKYRIRKLYRIRLNETSKQKKQHQQQRLKHEEYNKLKTNTEAVIHRWPTK